jgi:hypothetical protein
MRAMRFEAFGDPSALKVAEVPAPTIDETGRSCGPCRLRSIRATSRMSPER